jgi:pimeloyl-ACP methyl ester carboxylesterase
MEIPKTATNVMTSDGVRIAYERHGRVGGPIVVFVHGWSGEARLEAWLNDLVPCQSAVIPCLCTVQLVDHLQLRLSASLPQPPLAPPTARLSCRLAALL